VRARFADIRARRDRGEAVVAAQKLTPEAFVRSGGRATPVELKAFDRELGSMREDCGVPA
jgi:hypothetical protein